MVVGTARSFGLQPSYRIYGSITIYHTAAGILVNID
ncbi:hypothetical protein COOONC_15522 [Cooperia oncophora]